MRFNRLAVLLLAFCFATALSTFAQTSSTTPDDDAVPGNSLQSAQTKLVQHAPNAHSRAGSLNGFQPDTVPSFNGTYSAPGYSYDFSGNLLGFNSHWYTNTLGRAPQNGGTTLINAPIILVSLDLRNYDGSPRYVRQVNGKVFTCSNANQPGCVRLYYDANAFTENGMSLRNLVLNSPVFSNADYSSSSTPTQITDAVQRAEYYSKAKSDWHTLLSPAPKTPTNPYVMTLIRGTYRFALNPDGSCCQFVLVEGNAFGAALFPATSDGSDTTTIIGRAEHGDITQHDVSTFLFPNTYLYSGNPNNCCTVGYHTFDYEVVNKTPRFYVVNYSSWISPNLFCCGFRDVTALSHEVAEIFNDPFVTYDGIHNVSQVWLSPNGNCQNSIEVGDVVEGLANTSYPITMNGFTYHPQNEALLQWFTGGSDSLHGAVSYPDEQVLAGTSGVFNPPLFSNCQTTQ